MSRGFRAYQDASTFLNRHGVQRLSGALILLACSFAEPAQAGFFDLFFQRPAYPAAPTFGYSQPSTTLPSLNVNGRRKRVGPAAIKPARATAPPEVAPRDTKRILSVTRAMADVAKDYGHLVAFQIDPTLVHGDVVVTETGLHVFTGARAKVHRADAFQRLGTSPLAKRPDLMALQKSGRYEKVAPRGKLAFAEITVIQATRGGFADDSARTRRKGSGFKVVQSPLMR